MKLEKEQLKKIVDEQLRSYLTEKEKEGEEKGGSAGPALETGIVQVWNRETFEPAHKKVSEESCVKIVNYLKTETPLKEMEKTKAIHLGSGRFEVTPLWSKFFNGNVPSATKTPKTDMIIGKQKISLKGGKSAQLMSGGREESLATFNVALSAVNDIAPALAKKIQNNILEMTKGGIAAGEIRPELKKAKDKILMKADALNTELENDLIKLLNKNRVFANAFAYEAMTGAKKFGGNEGTCNTILASSWDGNNVKFEMIKINSKYTSAIADKMHLQVRFKTGSVKSKGKKTGQYRYSAVVGLLVSGFDKLHEECIKKNNGVLTEGMIGDFFKKLKDYILNLLKKIWEWLSQSVSHIIEFMGLEPEVNVEQNVDFLDA